MSSYSCCNTTDLKPTQVASLSKVLKVVADENRLKILCVLNKGTHCVCELIEHIGVSQSLISHHLRDLKDAGIIADKKDGLKVFYSLTTKGKHITKLIFKITQKEKSL